MKKTIKFSLLLAFLSFIAFVNPLQAQNINKEMDALAKKYEAAYNRKDDKALKEMYTTDAVRTAADGTTTNGNEAIRASLADFFKENKVTIKIKVDKSVTESDGSTTVTGSYHATGTSANGEKVDVKGAFKNTDVKENGTWKISKSVLTTM